MSSSTTTPTPTSHTTKVAVIGASGNIGSAITRELSSRGKYEIIAVARNSAKIDASLPHVKVVAGDASKPEELLPQIKGIDVFVGAIYFDVPPADLLDLASKAGAKRAIFVGGAASLHASEGGPRLYDTPEFPPEYKEIGGQGIKFYDALRAIDSYNWTFFSPPLEIGPGPRVGKFRVGGDVVIFDGEGRSRISYDDYAIALVDEIENGKYIKKRLTAAY